MSTVPEEQMNTFLDAAHQAAAFDLIRCSSGNLSWRIDEEHVLVSGTRSWLARLTTADVSVLRVSDGSPVNERKPSVETGFHLGILRKRDDVDVVLHFQSPYATTLACSKRAADINYYAIPEVAYYIGHVGVVPYLPPGSPDLAEQVVPCLLENNVAVLRNHGLVAVGKDLDDAIQRAVFFELACQTIVQTGNDYQPLTTDAVNGLQEMATGA